MKPDDLREEVAIDLEAMQRTVGELTSLLQDIEGREPTVREKTAAAAFLAQFYNGLENILKRICSYHDVSLPSGDTWHVELFNRFCEPPHSPLPLLFDERMATKLAPYRRFRHVAVHSYGFQLDWSRMAEGVVDVYESFQRFKIAIDAYLKSIVD